MRLAGIAACAVAVAACEGSTDLAECPAMPVKGWDGLLRSPAFAALSHKREQRYDPVTEVSVILWSDSNYTYERLLTFEMAHPRFAQGVPEERCIENASFMATMPLQGARSETVNAFMGFLASHGAPQALVKTVEAARDNQAPFAPVGSIAGAPVSAGVVVHGARGSFFRVEIGAAKR